MGALSAADEGRLLTKYATRADERPIPPLTMQIRSTDPSRSRSIDDLDEPSTAAPTGKPSVERAAPDWDRIPTLDAATLTAIQGGADDKQALMPKLEKLQGDLKALHDALAPYARECRELHHGAHELHEALELVKEAKHAGMFAPAVVGLAIAKAKHGVESIRHGWAGMHREAPEAARRAQPLLTKVLDDIADIKATLTPALDRPVTVQG
jgi:hypothetical protein